MTHVAIIGAGRWGRNLIETLRKNPTITIAYIAYSGSDETAAWLSAHHPDIKTTTDFRNVLQDGAVDAVCVATPIDTHGAIVREALTAGKHVFVEKPLSTNTKEIAALYTLAEEKNLTLFPGYIYRFDPDFKVAWARVAGKNDIHVETRWEKYGTFETPLTVNLLVHELALVSELIGTLALQNVARNETNVCDITVSGERGTAHIFINRTQKEKKKLLTIHNGAITETVPFSHNNLLDLECDAFFASVAHRSPDNKKRQQIDESIAAVLSSLLQP